jgi:filamentous hemagglutinin family protein
MKTKFSSKQCHRARATASRKWPGLAAVYFAACCCLKLSANPTGMTVRLGTATAQTSGAQLNLTVSQAAFLNWSSFNIQAGETTTFIQPSANSVVLNEIGGASPSQIFGNLNANGTVILANANGFYFGPNSMIKVGGDFIATTAPIAPDFGSGSSWTFTGMPPLASIINYGSIQAGNGRSLFLIAENIWNSGSLNAPGGNIGLAAGQTVLVSERPDGRGLSASVQVPAGSVNNLGQITADAGTIALQARVVNQNGIIQADSVQNQNGVIELVASDQLNLGANSQILARGDNTTPNSSGGTVTLQSGNNFSDSVGSQISVAGGSQGGNGGSVEISAENLGDIHSQLDGSAQAGFIGGEMLIDPTDLTLNSSSLNPYSGFANILFSATGNITLAQNTILNLSSSTGVGSGQLTMEAGGDIIFGSKSKIFDANDWSVSLYAGYNSANNTVQSGTGNIYLNGGAGLTQSGTIQLSAGDINLFAGQSILVAPMSSQIVSGSIFTTGGGNIFAYAMAGDIVAGTSNGSANGNTQTTDYNFTGDGYTVNPFLGGISTAAGGNVTLIAGNNIDSTPKVPSQQAPGASGTYGSGDVTVIAGNQITGNYTLADGVGTMLAGVPVSSAQTATLQNPGANPSAYAATLSGLETAVMQSQNSGGNIGAAPVAGAPSTSPVRLSLISGSWNAWAANDISIKEVNNPNGAFNSSDSFLFNYAPDAAANFWAGNAIELIGANLGRLTSANKTPIYAPILSLNAGAGGILIDESIILAPSSEGSLTIITRDGGNLSSAEAAGSTVLNGITMSDSASSDYTTFASGRDDIHLNDANPQPVYLNISGSINSFSLTVPTFASVNVSGDAYNFGFNGRNLSANQTTTITVTGNITYQPFSVANEKVTLGNQGLSLAGPGTFNITANSIDLGVSGGIGVLAPDAALAAISPNGANLNVTTLGDLSMTSTKISNESLLGDVTLNVGGTLDVGGQSTTLGDASIPKGIFTTGGGNVSVTADGNVNVASSRIAAYDGGNVSVTSQTGDVNAGTGGAGYVSFQALELDPTTGGLVGLAATIPGSGILATTIFGSTAALGNITVNAPNGSIKASSGGILQIAFNVADTKNNFIDLTAGHDITANGSGVLGYNIKLKAGGNIKGLVFGSQSVKINSQNNVNVTVVSGGNVDINASGAVSGTVISGGSLDVSGGSITAALIAESVSASGDTSGANMGIPQNVAKENAKTADGSSTLASNTNDQDDDLYKKKGKGIALAQKTGRVTIILPPKQQQPKVQIPEPRT